MELSESEKSIIFKMWNEIYPKEFCFQTNKKFELYLSNLKKPRHYIVYSKETIKVWLCSFDREGERWFALIVNPKFQKKGNGSQLLEQVQNLEPQLNGWVIATHKLPNRKGDFYQVPLNFYLKNGFLKTDISKFEKEAIELVKIKYSKQTHKDLTNK